MLRRSRILGTVGLMLAAIAIALGGYYYYTRPFSPDRERFPVRGIDVSHHQGKIDWRRVAADDVAFAIIKATEGGDHVDDAFAGNLREARAAGLAVGAYHFFTFCRPGADQAKNFIATVPRDKPLLPPVVDIEFHGNCPQRPSPEQLAAELQAFLDPVEAVFGKPAILYLTDEADEAYKGHVAERRRWIRSLQLAPTESDWIYWQYHDQGRVDGIEGDVDLNVLKGDSRALAGLFAPVPESSSPGTSPSP
jgi:lysozyme